MFSDCRRHARLGQAGHPGSTDSGKPRTSSKSIPTPTPVPSQAPWNMARRRGARLGVSPARPTVAAWRSRRVEFLCGVSTAGQWWPTTPGVRARRTIHPRRACRRNVSCGVCGPDGGLIGGALRRQRADPAGAPADSRGLGSGGLRNLSSRTFSTFTQRVHGRSKDHPQQARVVATAAALRIISRTPMPHEVDDGLHSWTCSRSRASWGTAPHRRARVLPVVDPGRRPPAAADGHLNSSR